MQDQYTTTFYLFHKKKTIHTLVYFFIIKILHSVTVTWSPKIKLCQTFSKEQHFQLSFIQDKIPLN